MPRTPERLHIVPSLTEVVSLFAGIGLVLTYAWLMDDAYVYFRYVDNLVVRGAGLVWNPGEYVEGFSSPLWAIFLIALRGLRVDFWLIVRAAGVVSFAAFWWLAILANRGLSAGRPRPSATYNLPLVFLSVCYAVICYFTSGLESPLVLVMAGAYACAVGRPGSVALQILLGMSALARPELSIPFVLFVVYARLKTGRFPRAAIVTAVAAVGGYVAFRIWYYADLFPNTFHLKDELWITQGATYLWDTFVSYWTLPFLGALVGLYFLLRRRHGPEALFRNDRLAMILMALPVAAYVVKIGGAPIHFKDLAFPFTLLVLAGGGLLETAAARWGRGLRALAVAGTLVVGLAVAFAHPRQLPRPPILYPNGFGNKVIGLISDAALHRSPQMGLIPGRGGGVDMLSFEAAAGRYEKGQRGAVHSESWCRTGYMRSSAQIVHSRGLTEPFLSRVPIHTDRPAHKFGLERLADDVARVRSVYGFRAGAFDRALENGRGEDWMRRNIESIHLIEARAYNEHDFFRNLAMAFRRPEVIGVEESEVGRSGY
jgi:hypothetical protein